jgi:glycosyltransferase involved in cell wall biosynthesis
MKILHIIASINPKGGGPMEGVLQVGLMKVKMGHSFTVLTLDDPASPFLEDYPLEVHAIGPSVGSYCYNSRLVPWLKENVDRYDIVIINGLWQYHGFGAWRVLHRKKTPYFVFCHGMLDPWFKHTYPLKHLKKWLYWPWAEYRLLRDARAVFFTCEEERILARQSFWLYKVREQVVNYGTKAPPSDGLALADTFYTQYPALREKRVFLFLSRIQEKKGCVLTIEAFAEVASHDARLHLVMAGPSQDKHQEKLQALAQRLGIADRITWTGMLKGDIKWGAFYASEAYVLFSHQENFGIAVAESLGCGTPVLISDKVNIWREIAADVAGIANPDTLAGTKESLKRWLAMDETARQQMGANAKRCFEERFTVEAMAKSIATATEKWLKYKDDDGSKSHG